MITTLATPQAPAASPPRPVTELVRARPREDAWPATGQSREEVWGRLAAEPFAPACDNNGRKFGLGLLLDWLADQPGATWQERWLASGADDDGTTGGRSHWVGCVSADMRSPGARSPSSGRCTLLFAPTSSGLHCPG